MHWSRFIWRYGNKAEIFIPCSYIFYQDDDKFTGRGTQHQINLSGERRCICTTELYNGSWDALTSQAPASLLSVFHGCVSQATNTTLSNKPQPFFFLQLFTMSDHESCSDNDEHVVPDVFDSTRNESKARRKWAQNVSEWKASVVTLKQ